MGFALALAPALASIGGASGALAAGSAGLSVLGSVMQFSNERKAAKANARQYAESAAQERDRAALEASDLTRDTRLFAARQVALGAGAGADVSSGSFLDLATESARAAEVDELRLLGAGARRSDSLRQQGREAARAGQARANGALISGLGKAFSQGSQAADWFSQRQPKAT